MTNPSQTGSTQPRSARITWRPEEFSLPIVCPGCADPRLNHVEAAGNDDLDGSQARLYHCPACEQNWWIFIRVVRGLPVLIANAP